MILTVVKIKPHENKSLNMFKVEEGGSGPGPTAGQGTTKMILHKWEGSSRREGKTNTNHLQF